MLHPSPAIRIFVHRFDTDMRKSLDGLSALVRNTFGQQLLSGDYFVFFNRTGDRCKILLWNEMALSFGQNVLKKGAFSGPRQWAKTRPSRLTRRHSH